MHTAKSMMKYGVKNNITDARTIYKPFTSVLQFVEKKKSIRNSTWKRFPDENVENSIYHHIFCLGNNRRARNTNAAGHGYTYWKRAQ